MALQIGTIHPTQYDQSGAASSMSFDPSSLFSGIGGAVAGGLNLYGNLSAQSLQKEMFQQQLGFNAASLAQTSAYNAQEAQRGRDFAAQQADLAWNRNLQESYAGREYAHNEAALAREFNREEAGVARSFAADQANAQRVFNQQEAAVGRYWQEQMSNTAYQRAMQDMRVAGLNPILAYQQGGASSGSGPHATSGTVAGGQATGGGASSGSASAHPGSSGLGSVSGVSAPGAPHLRSIMDGVFQSAMDVAKTMPAVQNLWQTHSNLKAEEQRILAEKDRTRADEQVRYSQRSLIDNQSEAIQRVTQGAGRAGEIESNYLNSWLGTGAQYIGKFLRDLIPLGGMTGSAKDIMQMVNPK